MILATSQPRARTLEDLLPPALAAGLDRLDVASRTLLRGTLPGERRSKRRGRSVEFDDFRNYVPGDDPRHIDWNIAGRLDKLFIKVFREEEDLSLDIVLDATASMDVGEPPKLLFAARLAMAMAYVGLVHHNRVSVAAFGVRSADAGAQHALRRLAPLRGRRSVQKVSAFLLEVLSAAARNERDPVGTRENPMDDALRTLAAARAGGRTSRGVTVLLSDFLADAPAQGLAYLASTGTSGGGGGVESYALQVLAPSELDPAALAPRGFTGDLRLTDIESTLAREVTVTPASISAYRAGLQRAQLELRARCTSLGIAHVPVATDADITTLLLTTLRRGGLFK